MLPKKAILTLTGSQFVAAHLAMRAIVHGRFEEAAEIMATAQLPLLPDEALGLWNEVVAKRHKELPETPFLIDGILVYDDGSADVIFWKVNRPKPTNYPASPATSHKRRSDARQS